MTSTLHNRLNSSISSQTDDDFNVITVTNSFNTIDDFLHFTRMYLYQDHILEGHILFF